MAIGLLGVCCCCRDVSHWHDMGCFPASFVDGYIESGCGSKRRCKSPSRVERTSSVGCRLAVAGLCRHRSVFRKLGYTVQTMSRGTPIAVAIPSSALELATDRVRFGCHLPNHNLADATPSSNCTGSSRDRLFIQREQGWRHHCKCLKKDGLLYQIKNLYRSFNESLLGIFQKIL